MSEQELFLLCHWLNLNLSTATKELENPEDTAEKVGISALIIQVGYYKRCLVFLFKNTASIQQPAASFIDLCVWLMLWLGVSGLFMSDNNILAVNWYSKFAKCSKLVVIKI